MNWYKKNIKLSEISLYHGTTLDNASSISEIGLVPDIGDFIIDMYAGGYETSGLDIEDHVSPLSFATDKHNMKKAVNAMIYQISKKLGKTFHEVTLQDIRNHGLLVKIPGKPGEAIPPSGWEQRPEDYDMDWEMMAEERGLHSVEPGDYYTEYPTGGVSKGYIQLIRGSALIRFLKRRNLI